MAKSNTSLLFDNTARRMKIIYKNALQQIEQHFPEILKNKAWSVARYNILNISNDQIRLFRNDLEEYCIYKYLAVNDIDHKIHTTTAGLGIILDAKFGWNSVSKPEIKLTHQNITPLLEIYNNIGVGIILNDEFQYVYYIVGIENCLKTLRLFDNILVNKERHQYYFAWRAEVAEQYIKGDWK